MPGAYAIRFILVCIAILAAHVHVVRAQTPPSASEVSQYTGLHKAAAVGQLQEVRALLASGANANERDGAGRTPAHVAAFGSHYDILRALIAGGGDIDALEDSRYDVITIAAVKDDVRMVELAVELGGNPKAITSRYDGTALIAAAHLGHDGVVRQLIAAGAPLDHVNNLHWTALIESIVLGNGDAQLTFRAPGFRLEGLRIELEQQLALGNDLSIREVDFHDVSPHARADIHRLRRRGPAVVFFVVGQLASHGSGDRHLGRRRRGLLWPRAAEDCGERGCDEQQQHTDSCGRGHGNCARNKPEVAETNQPFTADHTTPPAAFASLCRKTISRRALAPVPARSAGNRGQAPCG